MSEQVTVEDRRKSAEPTKVSMESLPENARFEYGGYIYRKAVCNWCERLTGPSAPAFEAFAFSDLVIPRPDLRLTMLLESQEERT